MVREMQRRITDVGRSLEVGMVTPPRSRGESEFETSNPTPVSRRLFDEPEYEQARSYDRTPSFRGGPRRLTYGEQESDRQDRALVVSTAAKPRQREQQASSSSSAAWESNAFDVLRDKGQGGFQYRRPSEPMGKPAHGVNAGAAMPTPMREMERYESRGYGRQKDTARREGVSGGTLRRDYDSEF
jgi:hypothetical protein